MNIYNQKRNWKIFLVASAALIVLCSLWYTNSLVKKIEKEERRKIKLWAEAIKSKAQLVNYTGELFQQLREEERKKVELWALGTRQITSADIDVTNLGFVLEVIRNNTTVPVIITDDRGKILFHRNLDSALINNDTYMKQELASMKKKYKPIEIEVTKNKKQYLFYKDSRIFSELQSVLTNLVQSFISEIVLNSVSVPVLLMDGKQQRVIAHGNVDSAVVSNEVKRQALISEMRLNEPIMLDIGGEVNYVLYKESNLLRQLRLYPFIQFGIIGLFLIIAYSLFSTARKAEQNQVWVGMSKETAHQLGTPLSSLMAWLEILKLNENIDPVSLMEMDKDVKRLLTITDRFSKIGSKPQLDSHNITEVMQTAVNYLKGRVSQKVVFTVNAPDHAVMVPVNIPLFEWVVENIIKNAIDAMEGVGSLTVSIEEQPEWVDINISDSGKGIPRAKFKTVFQPGFTTKQRGWGLGLSLAKRIIEEYHNGKIFVKQSDIDKGTTFTISLRS